MDRQRLHRLGKRLIALSRQVDLEDRDADQTTAAERLVLGDVVLYPGSTLRDIMERTGFAQSYVSECVAGLVQQGLLNTKPDEVDRRRTLVMPSADLVEAVEQRTKSIDALLAAELTDERDLQRVIGMLDDLAELLL